MLVQLSQYVCFEQTGAQHQCTIATALSLDIATVRRGSDDEYLSTLVLKYVLKYFSCT